MTDLSTTQTRHQSRVTILGSTGSIGTQALDVVRTHPNRFEVTGLSASRNSDLLLKQLQEFEPAAVALESGDASSLEGHGAEVLSGPGSAQELAQRPTGTVLNGIVGFAGLAATVSALKAKNRLALANKESIVAGGEWVMDLSKNNRIIPVDSEHSAIFQCIEGLRVEEVSGVLLTASGGPFYGTPKGELVEAGPEEALKHPTWSMGVKNTLDSATMMNKGLEVIEAHHLFGVPYDEIKVVVHRQSVVHGGVSFSDGAVVLHASPPDMRLPISYGMFYPERLDIGLSPTDFGGTSWTFDEPRDAVFRCLPLAYEAGRAGGAYPVVLNAANEVAVEAFLAKKIKFLGVADLIEEVLQDVPDFGALQDLRTIVAADEWAREQAQKKLGEVR